MIILSLMCAVLATWAVLPRPPSVWLSSRLSTSTNEKRERRRPRWWRVAVPLIAGIGVATAGALAGGASGARSCDRDLPHHGEPARRITCSAASRGHRSKVGD